MAPRIRQPTRMIWTTSPQMSAPPSQDGEYDQRRVVRREVPAFAALGLGRRRPRPWLDDTRSAFNSRGCQMCSVSSRRIEAPRQGL